MACVWDDDELAALDSFVQHARGARGGRSVVLAHDDEGRFADLFQLGAVVERAVARACEVAEDFR